MSQYGQTTDLAINFQNSFGTEMVNSLYWIPFLNESITQKKPPIITEELAGSYDEGPSYEGANLIDGEIMTDANPITLGMMLRALCGAPTSVQSGGIYTHTFQLRSTDFDDQHANDPLTFYKYMNTGSAELMYDMCANELELSCAMGELLGAKLGLVGGSYKQTAAVAAVYPAEDHLMWDAASASFASAANDQISEITINVNQSLEAMHTFNSSKSPSRVKRTGFRSTGISGTLKFEDQDEYQDFIAQNERLFELHFQDDTEIQSGYYNALTIVSSAFRYEEFEPAVGGAGPIEVSFTGKAKGRTNPITFILVNTQAAY